MPKRNHYDIVILGAGPAGLAAAVYAARAVIEANRRLYAERFGARAR